MRLRSRATVAAVLACVSMAAMAPRAAAQSSDAAPMANEGALAFGAELSAVAGPVDHTDYFNYTNYDENALRLTRVRLIGEWRLSQTISLMGELRVDDADTVSLPAFYGRWQPPASRNVFVQVGRIPPVFGSYPRRAYGHDNVVIGEPLAYQYLTPLRPDALPMTTANLLAMRGHGWQPSYPLGSTSESAGVPLIDVSRWDTGAEATWQRDWLEVAGALSRGSPAVPVVRDTNGGLMWSGRVSGQWANGLTLGFSGARGEWIDDSVLSLTSGGTRTPAEEVTVGADAEFGRGPWLVRGEWIHARFDLPLVDGPASGTRLPAWSGFAEARYRFLPRWQIGMRADTLRFGEIPVPDTGESETWDAPVARVEATLGFRITRGLEVRGGWQENWRRAYGADRRGYPALGVLYWF